jgi:N-acetylglucosaminyldiphosphoundecaprenol N-acetyl-beta-D-mannosaminyltransferase
MREDRQKTSSPFGITIDALTREEFLERVRAWTCGVVSPRLITYLNAHCINLYFKNLAYARIIDGADCVYADGQAVVWAAKFLGEQLPERINAGDFFPQFCAMCVSEGFSLYLLGSHPGVADKAAGNIKNVFPHLKVAGCRSGYFSPDEEPVVVKDIVEAHPSILLIGMGVPLQEIFAASRLNEMGVPVVWCVGALFEYFAGVTRRAPVWMRRIGLEWIFRLVMEPRRLWRRYLPGNASFLMKVIKHRFKRRHA